ncbi:MAG TPA: YqaA family protein [Geminicoccaceae bacterium]|nr:YqaA family protein [Geminicoccaceae bacterium]
MLRRLYDWVMVQAAGPRALRALGVVAFLESSVFPIPPDAMIVPMVVAKPEDAWRIAAVATAASVVGGLAGYAIGYFLLETVGQWIIHLYGLASKVAEYQAAYSEWGLWIILIKGLTPIPYKLVTIASGMAHFSLIVFTLASILTRGARFFLLAALLRAYGPPIRRFIEQRLTLVTSAFAALIVLGFVSLRYV